MCVCTECVLMCWVEGGGWRVGEGKVGGLHIWLMLGTPNQVMNFPQGLNALVDFLQLFCTNCLELQLSKTMI